MNFGEKIAFLKDRHKFKDYVKFGEFVGLPSDWLLEQSKKTKVTMIDVTRLIKIADRCKVPLDWLLKDTKDDGILYQEELSDSDILMMMNRVQLEVSKEDCRFNGVIMSKESCKIAYDSIDVCKKLINLNI